MYVYVSSFVLGVGFKPALTIAGSMNKISKTMFLYVHRRLLQIQPVDRKIKLTKVSIGLKRLHFSLFNPLSELIGPITILGALNIVWRRKHRLARLSVVHYYTKQLRVKGFLWGD
jgi:hypothetical protein